MVEIAIENLSIMGRFLNARWQHLARLLGVLLMAVALSGCVEGQVGITFDSPHSGQVVQHLKLDTPLAQSWLQDLEQRAQGSGGRVTRRSGQELDIVLPFTNAADLERRFNTFFNPAGPSAGAALPSSHLTVTSSNLLLWQRLHLVYDLDLAALGLQGSDGQVLASSGELVDLDFGLTTPWGAGSRSGPRNPSVQRQGNSLHWQLQPGQTNHIEAWFWMPSPLGWGAVLIALLIVIGTWLKLPTANLRSSP
jgi:Protein of unknown function (DUF3153)